VSEAGTAAARDRLLRPGVEITPRRMWPTGMKELGIDVSGKIGPELSAEPGRALGRLTDLGWGPRLRRLLADGGGDAPAQDGTVPGGDAPAQDGTVPGGDAPAQDGTVPDGAVPDGASPRGPSPDGPVPDDFIAAVVKVLAAWDWEQRPAAVVTLPSRTRPQLVGSLGRRIAEIGRIPYLGGLGYTGAAATARPARQYNSAQRLAALWRELTVPDALGGEIAGVGGPVLLVDDRVETGWTMTVAAKLLREAGAAAVLPLVLAVSS
jgi:ATP-dependent DNA helicase RecQ